MMIFKADDSIQQQIRTVSIIPERYKKLLMPSAIITYSEGPFGVMLSQKVQGNFYNIWQHHFFISQKVAFYPDTDVNLFILSYVLKGTVNCKVPGIGKLVIPEGRYHLYRMASKDNQVIFNPGDYHFFHIDFEPECAERMAQSYPRITQLLAKILREPGASGRLKYTARITWEIRNLVWKIIYNKEQEPERNLTEIGRIMDLLVLFIRDFSGIEDLDDQLAIMENNIEKVRMHIENNLQEDLSIDELAHLSGMNSSTLKRNFRRFTGTAIHQFIIDKRMKKAKELITQNIPVHEVAALAGYTSHASFTTAYRSHFGEAPIHSKGNKKQEKG
ncbi:AraC family transcriptional regulator [Mucilaginibacter paludis]|nr:AraC family transcriptional regulator [Mucilaginibacter paludis]